MASTSKAISGAPNLKEHLDVIVEAVYGKRDFRKIRKVNVSNEPPGIGLPGLGSPKNIIGNTFEGDLFEVAVKRRINNVSSIYVSSSDEEE